MSVRYDKLIPALKALLPETRLNLLGRSVTFIRRLREITASHFIWSVVMSRFGNGRPAFEQARHWYHRLTETELWPRPFQMRFKSAAAVRMFEQAFEDAVKQWRVPALARHPLARHFPDVAVVDSTQVELTAELRPIFKGSYGHLSSLKVLLTISVFGLVPLCAAIVSGNRHDMLLFPPLEAFRPGTLMLFDKGFVAYSRLRAIREAGHHYLCPMRLNGNALVVAAHRAPAYVKQILRRNPDGVWLRDILPTTKRIGKSWDLDVVVRPRNRRARASEVHARLVIVPGPNNVQRPYLTDLDRPSWSPAALAELYRLRWQVELVFKELKQELNLESVPSNDRHAVQVLVWASLIALALSRTVSAWLCPRIELVGLGTRFRPALTSRALRGAIRSLARALLAPPRLARLYLKDLADDLLLAFRARDSNRGDSFARLEPLLRGP